MKKLTLFSLALAMAAGFTAKAQDEMAEESMEEPAEKIIGVSGSVDVYYRQLLTADNNDAVQPYSSFANGTGFSLGMANVIVSHEGSKAGAVADLVFGPRGAEAVFNSGPFTTGNIVNQLYAYFNISDNVTFTIGNFNTFLGYEVISPTANFNYSTSYMFSYGPFSHTGAKLDIGLSDEFSLMVGVFNPTDITETIFNGDPAMKNTYSAGLQLGYENDMGGAWLNVLVGDQDGAIDEDAFVDTSGVVNNGMLFQIDLTTGWNVTEELYLGLNATYNTTSIGSFYIYDTTAAEVNETEISGVDNPTFIGAALYAQYAFSDAFSLGLRGEYFSEVGGGAGAIGAYDTDGAASVIDLTLSGNIFIGDLTLIPEFRVDLASEDAFIDADGAATSSLASFTLAAVYAF